MSGQEESGSTFFVDQKQDVSREVCEVSGKVEAGQIKSGDIMEVTCPLGDRFEAPVLSVRSGIAGGNRLSAGESGTLTLRIDPGHVAVGDRVKGRSVAKRPAIVKRSSRSAGLKRGAFSERPGELRAIENDIKRGHYEEADKALSAHLQRHPGSTGARRLRAELLLTRNSPFYDREKGLQVIRAVYNALKVEDPAVTWLLATALAENGDADMGVHLLESSYANLMDTDSTAQFARRIGHFREAHGLGDIWELADQSGVVILESKRRSEIVQAVRSGAAPANAVVRLNRIGPWQPLSIVLPDSMVRQTDSRRREKHVSATTITLLAVLAVLAVLAILVYQGYVLYWLS